MENDTLEHDTESSPSLWSGLRMRIISGAVLAVSALFVLWLGGWWFKLLVMIAALQMIREWDYITTQEKPVWKLIGLLYAAIPCTSLTWLRGIRLEDDTNVGVQLILFVLLCVWSTDIGAYFAGRRIGGPKLAPAVSPNKTWAGLGGGILAAAIVGGISHSYAPFPASLLGCMALGALLAVVAQAGDLFESWLKRRAGVKDSGTLIPGHGGLLDRIDGLTFTMPLFAALIYFVGNAS